MVWSCEEYRGRDNGDRMNNQAHLPFLVDKFNTASADTWVVQGFVWGTLGSTHTTNIRYRNKQTHVIYEHHYLTSYLRGTQPMGVWRVLRDRCLLDEGTDLRIKVDNVLQFIDTLVYLTKTLLVTMMTSPVTSRSFCNLFKLALQ